MSYDDAYSFALRIAFLRYLLQPRKKRKEYVSTPKPAPRHPRRGLPVCSKRRLKRFDHRPAR